MAARIVNKQRSQYGETQGEKKKDRHVRSPDRNLPIKCLMSTVAEKPFTPAKATLWRHTV